jgi:replicative DNA helicase
VYILAGDPGVGKTAFACNLSNRCLNQNKRVLYYAIETGNEVIDYMASVRLERPFRCLTDDELKYNDPNFLMYRDEVISLPDLKATLKEQRNNFDLAIVDNIGFFEEKSSSPTQAQLELMRDLSKLALESQIAIILIAHFNKQPPGGKNIVTMDRISGSKAFQNYAKGVLLMKRNKKSDLPGEMEYLDDGLLIVAKSKRGANKAFRLIFSNASAVIKTDMDFAEGTLERQGF